MQRVWNMAGLPTTSGYAATLLAMAVATNRTLTATLTTVDFDAVDSVANAVEGLLQWRDNTFRVTS